MTTPRFARTLKALVAVLAVSATIPAIAPAAYADSTDALACTAPPNFVAPKLGGSVLTPEKSFTMARSGSANGGFVVAVESTGSVTVALRDAATGAIWYEGVAGPDAPFVAFTTPSPYSVLCLEVVNADSLPVAFAYAFERLS